MLSSRLEVICSSSQTATSTMTPTATTSLPLTFGRYRLLEEIGAGGMARVYRAEMKGPGGFSKPVAVKRIHAAKGADSHFVSLFEEEARVGAGLLNAEEGLQDLQHIGA